MLLQFTVENYLSFDEPTTFSMRAGKDKDLPHHVLGGKHPAVKGAAIYGANAAGKSNLVLAMGFARDLIVKGRSMGQVIPVQSFGLGGETGRPSGFHWQFVYGGTVWSYGFDVTKKHIVEEYLFARDESGGTEKMWFKRTTDEDGTVKVKFGAALRGPAKGKLARRLELIAENLRSEQPFLIHAIENRVDSLGAVWEWFKQVLVLMRAETKYEQLFLLAHSNQEFLKFLSEVVQFADTGISGLIPHEEELVWGQNFSVGVGEAEIREALDSLPSDGSAIVKGQRNENSVEELIMAVRRDKKTDQLMMMTLLADHDLGNKKFQHQLTHESEGTQRLIHLTPVLFKLRTEPTVLVIDELDRRLHTLLVQEFVKIALSEQSKGQLIFTTHDTNLLDNWLLRRDEIHFVQKDKGRSTLSRLSEWNVRKDLDYEKAYLRGNFEGRPYFRFSPLLRGMDGENTSGPTEEELRAQLSQIEVAPELLKPQLEAAA